MPTMLPLMLILMPMLDMDERLSPSVGRRHASGGDGGDVSAIVDAVVASASGGRPTLSLWLR